MSANVPPLPPAIADDFALSDHGEVDHGIYLPLPVAQGHFGIARRTLGIITLLSTVVLWTASSFLASSIFADETFSKPYFLTYVNTAFFAVSLIPIILRKGYQHEREATLRQLRSLWRRHAGQCSPVSRNYGGPKADDEDDDVQSASELSESWHSGDQSAPLQPGRVQNTFGPVPGAAREPLTTWQTGTLSLQFCILWFAANYFASACLEYTTVASATILTSTSSIWTLLFGFLISVETFTVRKLVGVCASLVGIALISTVDFSHGTGSDDERGSFPSKSPYQLALGNGMALVSAVLYGFYTVLMKKRLEDESRVNMPLFFGIVGLFNLVLLWPGLVVLHFGGIERFEMPPTGHVWLVIFSNSTISLISDLMWAYAMLLTSPLIITIGLSLSIPLSLVGQMILQNYYSSVAYWIGAIIVVSSFVFITHEDKGDVQRDGQSAGLQTEGESR